MTQRPFPYDADAILAFLEGFDRRRSFAAFWDEFLDRFGLTTDDMLQPGAAEQQAATYAAIKDALDPFTAYLAGRQEDEAIQGGEPLTRPMRSGDMATIEALHGLYLQTPKPTWLEFWDAFTATAGDIEARAFARDADPELREAYCHVLANAEEAGFDKP